MALPALPALPPDPPAITATQAEAPVHPARLGRAHLAEGDFEAASRAYELALKQDRRLAVAYLGLAWSWIGRQQYGMAYVPLEEGLRLMPTYQPGWRELGRCYYYMKRYDRSLTALNQALRLRQSDADSWLLKGLTLVGAKRPQDALPALERATSLAPHDPLPRRMTGQVLLTLGKPAQAEVALESALALQPADPKTGALLVDAYRAQGKHWEALGQWWRNTQGTRR